MLKYLYVRAFGVLVMPPPCDDYKDVWSDIGILPYKHMPEGGIQVGRKEGGLVFAFSTSTQRVALRTRARSFFRTKGRATDRASTLPLTQFLSKEYGGRPYSENNALWAEFGTRLDLEAYKTRREQAEKQRDLVFELLRMCVPWTMPVRGNSFLKGDDTWWPAILLEYLGQDLLFFGYGENVWSALYPKSAEVPETFTGNGKLLFQSFGMFHDNKLILSEFRRLCYALTPHLTRVLSTVLEDNGVGLTRYIPSDEDLHLLLK